MTFSKYTGFEERQLRGEIQRLHSRKCECERRYRKWLDKIRHISEDILPKYERERALCEIKITERKARLGGKYSPKRI